MKNCKMLLAKLFLVILLSCAFTQDTPLQFQDVTQTAITANAAASYNKATIKKVQKKLIRYGYDCGSADGIAGSQTKKAVKKYQKDNDLTVTGSINAKLLKSLGIKPVKDAPATSASAVDSPDTSELTVYITDTGSKYHRSGCRYLSRSRHAISRSDAQSAGYDACSVCRP